MSITHSNKPLTHNLKTVIVKIFTLQIFTMCFGKPSFLPFTPSMRFGFPTSKLKIKLFTKYHTSERSIACLPLRYSLMSSPILTEGGETKKKSIPSNSASMVASDLTVLPLAKSPTMLILKLFNLPSSL